jgi:type IV pilus assembly protein PilB
LVRTICATCITDGERPTVESLVQIGFHPQEAKTLKLFRGVGCDECAHTGYRGRTALYEVMTMTTEVRDLVVARAHAADIAKVAVAQGMRTLREAGLAKVRRGETTIEEVLRVTGID